MNTKLKSLILTILTLVTLSGCETGRGMLADTTNVLNSVASIINSGRTIGSIGN